MAVLARSIGAVLLPSLIRGTPPKTPNANLFFNSFSYILNMKVLVVDLDNTLFNTQARYNACLAEQGVASLDSLHGEARRKFWECYQSPKYLSLIHI